MCSKQWRVLTTCCHWTWSNNSWKVEDRWKQHYYDNNSSRLFPMHYWNHYRNLPMAPATRKIEVLDFTCTKIKTIRACSLASTTKIISVTEEASSHRGNRVWGQCQSASAPHIDYRSSARDQPKRDPERSFRKQSRGHWWWLGYGRWRNRLANRQN